MNDLLSPVNSIHGYKVVVSPDLPKMKLAQGDYITPEFRDEIDAWLLSFFGAINLVPDGITLISEYEKSIWMNPRTYADINRAFAK